MGFSYKQLLRIFFPPSPDELLFETAAPSAFSLASKRRTAHTTTLLPYHNPAVRAAIHLAKFHHHTGAIATLGGVLTTYLEHQPTRVLVPLPLSRKRYRERGYNQVVEIISRAKVGGAPLTTALVLIRQRHTKPQADLDRETRLRNVAGAFAVNTNVARQLPRHTPLLIIDDVATTGATLHAARKALLEAGFSDVECLAIAH